MPPSYKPVERITDRHRVLAALWAMGWTNADISREFGYNQTRLSLLKSDPRIKLMVQEEQKKLFARVHDGFVSRAVPFEEWLDTEEEENRRRWKELRDQDENLPVSLGAINSVWDRRYPKKQSREEERTIKLVLEKGDWGQLEETIKEVEGVVVEDENNTDQTVPKAIKPVQPEDLSE